MTTIVYCHKTNQIACDSRSTNGYMIVTDGAMKHIKVNDLEWFISGRAGEAYAFANNFKELDIAMDGLGNDAIFISKGSAYLASIDEGRFRSLLLDVNQGIGSGGYFAMAALDFGKTAKEAVEYAITKDFASGGKVHVFDIDTNKFIDDVP